MAHLNVTIIDVGWGDSIFIEHVDSNGTPHYALVDSNDEKDINSTRMFIERYFRLMWREITNEKVSPVRKRHGIDICRHDTARLPGPHAGKVVKTG